MSRGVLPKTGVFEGVSHPRDPDILKAIQQVNRCNCDLRFGHLRAIELQSLSSRRGVDGLFSPEKDVFISADTDSFIYEWDLGTGRCLQRVKDRWAKSASSKPTRICTAPFELMTTGRSSPARGYKFGCVFVPIRPVITLL